MIVGATPTPDAAILRTSSDLYTRHKLRRVYYSAYSPIPFADARLPSQQPPLVREHRLYQADWLLRFYRFKVDELTTAEEPNLDLSIDPKLSWALRNRAVVPGRPEQGDADDCCCGCRGWGCGRWRRSYRCDDSIGCGWTT